MTGMVDPTYTNTNTNMDCADYRAQMKTIKDNHSAKIKDINTRRMAAMKTFANEEKAAADEMTAAMKALREGRPECKRGIPIPRSTPAPINNMFRKKK